MNKVINPKVLQTRQRHQLEGEKSLIVFSLRQKRDDH